MELTENQFNILKKMCESHVYFVLIPDILDSDPDIMKTNHAEHVATFKSLVELGFMEDITHKFSGAIAEIKAEREKAIEAGEQVEPYVRGFVTYCLTQQAILMFDAPEGVVN